MKRFLLAIFSFFILPVVCFAVEDVDYDISNYYIKANIMENGDLKVKELIVLDGSFNGYERTILYNGNFSSLDFIDFDYSPIYNPTGISDVKISAKYMNDATFDSIDDDDFEEFTKFNYASSGDKRKYINTSSYRSETYRMYYESRGRKVGFLIEYTLKDFVVVHNDVAELYWQIVTGDADYNDDLNDVKVEIYLPSNDTSDYFRVWAHGPLFGDVSKSGDNKLVATVNELDKSEDFDIRISFDKSLVQYVSNDKNTNIDGFHGILKVEQERADIANVLRNEYMQQEKQLQKDTRFTKWFSIVVSAFDVLGILFIFFKFKLKPKTDFDAKYYREFIEDYSVEVVDYLYNKTVTPKALSAGIMNLVYNKVCSAQEIHNDKNSKRKNYKFVLNTRDNLSESDLKLVEFLFDRVGNGEEFTTEGLKEYASELNTGSTFQKSYTNWQSSVKKNGESQGFFQSKIVGGFICAALFIPGLFIFCYGLQKGVDSAIKVLPLLISVVMIIFCCSVKSYSSKGALHIKKWNAFKNFLNDFGTFETKDLPEIALWERYMVYATVFGLAKKLQKDIEVKIKELNLDETYVSTNYTNIYMYDSISRSFSNAVTDGRKAYAASRANAYSSSSSGGGFGGGFSSGGGFGGGGGGGHGF